MQVRWCGERHESVRRVCDGGSVLMGVLASVLVSVCSVM